MQKNILKIMAFLMMIGTLATSAQVTVRKTAGSAVGVDLSGVQARGGAAMTVRKTLEKDLGRSGWMKLAARGKGAVLVSGPISESGGELQFACTVTDSAGRSYIHATYRQPANQAITLAHQVANDIILKVTGKPSFTMAKLVMVGVKGGSKELYLADSSVQNIQPVTKDRSIAIKPRWSPDNRYIAYTSYLKRNPYVYMIELSTGSRKLQSSYPGVNSGGSISPDGRSMALILSKHGNPDLYVQDIASRRLTRLTHTRAVEGSPCWSPDGSRIAYVSDATGSQQLYLVSRSGGAPKRLTRSGRQNASPDWGSNGLIAYQTLTGGKFQIAVIDPNTSQGRVITPYDAAYEDPSWAPDGRHLAASRAVNYNYSVYLLDSMGDKPVALTSSGDWRAPAWSR